MNEIAYHSEKANEAALILARQCLDKSIGERPELTWLKCQYEKKRKALHLSKAEMDSLLYRRMNGQMPVKPSDTLKIRYWRTGHHAPLNRDICSRFGKALQFSETEQQYLLQAYLDKSFDTYTEVPSADDRKYWKRRSALDRLVAAYLDKSHQTIRHGGRNSVQNFRHLYYTDAIRFTQQADNRLLFSDSHIYSARYDMELKNNLKLIGEIPRKTMIRHFVILGMPNLSIDWMNYHLELFGYLPLSEKHTLRSGEYLDQLLIGILKLYSEQQRQISEPQQWFCCCCRELDNFFQRRNNNAFRFMYFKSLE